MSQARSACRAPSKNAPIRTCGFGPAGRSCMLVRVTGGHSSRLKHDIHILSPPVLSGPVLHAWWTLAEKKRTPWLNAITCKPLSSAYLRQGASAQPGSTDRYQQPPVHFAARRQRCRLRVTVQVQHDMFGFHYGPPTNILRLEHITMFERGEQTRQPASVERKKKGKEKEEVGLGGIYGLVDGCLLGDIFFARLVLYTRKGKRAWYSAVDVREI